MSQVSPDIFIHRNSQNPLWTLKTPFFTPFLFKRFLQAGRSLSIQPDRRRRAEVDFQNHGSSNMTVFVSVALRLQQNQRRHAAAPPGAATAVPAAAPGVGGRHRGSARRR